MIKRGSLVLSFLVTLFSTLITAQEADLIKWCDTCKLKLSDFQGEVPENTKFGAVARTNIYSGEWTRKDYLKVEVYSYFNRSTSWVLPEERKEEEAVLKHEQGHFDITEIYCRRYKKELLENGVKKWKARREATKLYWKYYNLMIEEQKRYDEETRYSRDEVTQQEWLKWISEELEILEKYNQTKIQVPYK